MLTQSQPAVDIGVEVEPTSQVVTQAEDGLKDAHDEQTSFFRSASVARFVEALSGSGETPPHPEVDCIVPHTLFHPDKTFKISSISYGDFTVCAVAFLVDGAEPSVTGTANHGHAWMHVNTGATVMKEGELCHPMGTSASCGTAAEGSQASAANFGTSVFCFFIAGNDQPLTAACPNAREMPSFRRCSISLHVLRSLGFDCGHILLEDGGLLWLQKNAKSWHIPLHTVNESDFALVKLHLPQARATKQWLTNQTTQFWPLI